MPRLKTVRDEMFERDGGMGPCNRFFPKFKIVRFLRSPSWFGTIPVIMFEVRSRTRSSINLLRLEGKDPSKLLELKLRTLRRKRFVISFGIGPRS